MNDKTLIEDVLTSIKAQCDMYLHGTIEASTPQVHDVFNNALFETLRIQNELYSKMTEKGWYQPQQAQQNKIQQVEQKYIMQ